ncbi:MAG: DUF4175 family protein [Myxococcales bacterium]|nr:DUF4175 family protein [Myxococcales bacterium]
MIAAVSALALMVILLAAALGGASWLRISAQVTALALPTGLLLRLFIVPWWRSRSDAAVAAVLEQAAPSLGDGLLASVELQDHPDRAADPTLIPALFHQVAARLEVVDVRAATPFRPARRAWLGAAAVLGVWALAGLTFPGVIARGYAALTASAAGPGGGDEETGPLVGDLTLTLHFPAHTGRPSQVIPNSAGDLEAPKGTRVEITATTLEPAARAVMRLGEKGSSEVNLAIADQRELRGELVVGEPTVWRFALTTPDGRALVEGLTRRIRVETDRPPEVTLKLPAEDMELEDLRSVPVAYGALDDYGLSKVNVVVALAADMEHPEKIEQIGVSGRRHEGVDEVDLRIVQAQPGDRLALFVEAFDNNGVDGPQRGMSAVRFITVHSPQAKHQALAEDLQRTIDLLLTALADRLEMAWRDAAAGPLPPRVASLQEGTRKATDALDKVVRGMTEDPLTPEEVRLALTGRLGALEAAIEAERAAVEASPGGLERQEDATVRVVQKASEGIVDELEQAIILVEAMVARLALEDMRALADELKEAKERLKDLIQEFKKHPDDEALKARIMREVQRLRQRIDEMRQRMAKLRQKLPEEFLNLDGMKKDDVAKGLDQTKDQLAELEKMLNEGKIDEALAALEQMEQALDELGKSLDEDLDDLHKSSNPEMQKALSELMDQTRDMMKRQEELAKETEQMAEAQREALRKLLEEKLKEKMDGLRKKGEALERALGEVKPDKLSNVGQEELSHLEQRVAELRGGLERNQILESLEMSERSLDHLERIQRFDGGRFGSPENQKPLDEAEQLDRQIVQELSQLLDQARAQQQQQQQGDGQQSQRLGQQQQQLSEAMQKLQQRLAEQGEKMPGMGDKPMQSAEQAKQAMREAAQRLGQEQPGQARPGQQQAMESLKGIMDGLRQANKPQRAERNQGRKLSHERVNIPGADQYEAPEAWRKDLLDAMKEAPPEQFRDQVKRYYEALIQ